MDSTIGPKFAPPGAGLPAFELFIARLLFGLRRLTAAPEECDANFRKERNAIRELLREMSETAGARRVLVRRPRGLEDSSRFWSVWMTLDHLRIVNLAIAGVIEKLSRDEVSEGVASTAAVKPSPESRRAVEADYEDSCEAVLAAAHDLPGLRTKLKYTHPWFGSMDAAGWHALAGTHMAIHRLQLERICAGLETARVLKHRGS